MHFRLGECPGAFLGVAGFAAGNAVVKIGFTAFGQWPYMVKRQVFTLKTTIHASVPVTDQDVFLAKRNFAPVNHTNDF